MGSLAHARVALPALIATLVVVAPVHAQDCAAGRVASEETGWRCCWPGQTWEPGAQHCQGTPTSCPAPRRSVQDDCVASEVPRLRADALRTGAAALATPVRLDLRVPIVYRRTVNHNVIGGAIGLFLATYGGSVAFAFLGGGVPFLVPLGCFYGLAEGAVFGVLGFAFGAGQIISIVLMAAGGSFFRRSVIDTSVQVTADGVAVRF